MKYCIIISIFGGWGSSWYMILCWKESTPPAADALSHVETNALQVYLSPQFWIYRDGCSSAIRPWLANSLPIFHIKGSSNTSIRHKHRVTYPQGHLAHLFLSNSAVLNLLFGHNQEYNILLTQLMQLLGSKRIRTTTYHPIANGFIKQLHRQLKSVLKYHTNSTHRVESLLLILGTYPRLFNVFLRSWCMALD